MKHNIPELGTGRSRWKFTKLPTIWQGVAVGLLLTIEGAAQLPVTLYFDTLSSMANSPGSLVPEANRLSNQYATTYGVVFSSAAPYVAVVNIETTNPGSAVSPPNAIGGVTSGGLLSYGTPFTVTFVDPANPANPGVTDFVSIRGDKAPTQNGVATMTAYDVRGRTLTSVIAADSSAGLTLSASVAGIHRVVISQNSAEGPFDGTIAFDNLQFNQVVAAPVPEPVSALVAGLGLAALAGHRRLRLSRGRRPGPCRLEGLMQDCD